MAHDADRLASVPPGQHRRRDAIAKAQLWLPVAAIVGAGLYWAGGHWLRGEARYLPRPLAHVHAALELSCAACHVTAEPLGGEHWLSAVRGNSHVADVQCQSCHAGPPHHPQIELPGAAPGCTTCHTEHQGRDRALTRVPDAQCLRCHHDLTQHVVAGKTPSFASGFTVAEHPDFRIFKEKDPGTVAFNHALHMMPGLRAKPGSAVPFTLGDIPGELRSHYARPGADQSSTPVQLDCASCHQLDPSSGPDPLPGAFAVTRPAGATMLPIVFERHCQACHPLTFQAAPTGDPKGVAAAVQHRLQPEDIRTWLRGHFTEQLLQTKLLPAMQRPVRPLPGKSVLSEPEAKAAAAVLDKEIHAAENILYGANTCQKCHPQLDRSLRDKQRVAPAQIPSLWLKHARFDHTAHRAVDCRECHARAFALQSDGTTPNPEASTTNADVLLPGVQTCIACHSPAERVDGVWRGGARHDCVECHRYHAADDPAHGRGAKSRQPAAARGLLPWRAP